MSRGNWDDLRYVLAVADAGSVSGAARALGVNHATVLRRVAAFEAESGSEIFDKTAKGYFVPASRRGVIEAAREVDAAFHAVGRILTGTRAPLLGKVRVTTTDTIAQCILPAIADEIASSTPELELEIISSNQPLDLGRGAADITIRATESLPPNLFGETPVRLGFGAYAPKDRVPESWIGLAGRLGSTVAGKWMAEAIDPTQIACAADSFLVVAELAARGIGLAAIPHIVGQSDPRLDFLAGMMPDMAVDVWVACHVDLAGVPRIARVRDLLADALAKRADQFKGPVSGI